MVADHEAPALDSLDVLRELIEFARLAPSSQNTQPWRFRTGPARIDVFLEPSRRLPVADGDGREQLVSVGCALEMLLIAAERRGLTHTVDLFPRPGRDDLVATVRFRRRTAADGFRDPALFEAIGRRQTHHGEFEPVEISAETLERLRAVTLDGEIGVAIAVDPDTRARVGRLAAEAARVEHADPAYRRERAAWVGTGALGTRQPVRALTQFILPLLDIGERVADRDGDRMAHSAAAAVIVSMTDDRRSRVAAGQAALRFWLLATHLGLAVQPMTAALHVPKLRRALGAAVGAPHFCPQMLFRLGHAGPEEHSTPRLPTESVYAS